MDDRHVAAGSNQVTNEMRTGQAGSSENQHAHMATVAQLRRGRNLKVAYRRTPLGLCGNGVLWPGWRRQEPGPASDPVLVARNAARLARSRADAGTVLGGTVPGGAMSSTGVCTVRAVVAETEWGDRLGRHPSR